MVRVLAGGLVAALPAAGLWVVPQLYGVAAVVVVFALGFPWDLLLFFVLASIVGSTADLTNLFGAGEEGVDNVLGICLLAGAFINGCVIAALVRGKGKPTWTSNSGSGS